MNTMVGLEASLHTSVGGEEDFSNSMKGEKGLDGLTGSLKSSGAEDQFANSGNTMGDEFDPDELLNSPLFHNSVDKLQESFANELSFGTFQSDSLPSSCRDPNEDLPRPTAAYYGHVASSEPNKTLLHVASAASVDSPGSVDSFANDASPRVSSSQHDRPPVAQLSIPSGSFSNHSHTQQFGTMAQMQQEYANTNSNYNGNGNTGMNMNNVNMMSSEMLYSNMQQHQGQQTSVAAPMGLPPQVQSNQQFSDMQAMQMMQMQNNYTQQQQQQQPQHYQQHFDVNVNHTQSGDPSNNNMQVYHSQSAQANYAPTPQAPLVNNQALPNSIRISPTTGRPYPVQGSVSMSQLAQMRSTLQGQQQQLPFLQNMENTMNSNNNSNIVNNNSIPLTSHSLHGETYGGASRLMQQQTFNNMPSAMNVNQSLSQSLHDPMTTQRRSASFHGTSALTMPLQASNTPGAPPPSINDAMAQLCDSMRRSAMSRSFVKQLSGRNLTGPSMGARAVGRTNSLHSQNSARSILLDDTSGRSVPVRRTSSSAKYHLQHPVRGMNRHDSQQSLGRSNHSTTGSVSFD